MKLKSLFVILIIVTLIGVGCSSTPSDPNPNPDPGNGNQKDPVDPEPDPGPDPDEFDFELYQPNELGEIPVFMYHRISDKEEVWARTVENFRNDLQRYYDAGYRLVSLTDVYNNNIDIPAGTSPLVLTFDDGTTCQFRWLKEDGELVVDPDCAVGIILDFAEENPDMGTAATFFVNASRFAQGDSWYNTDYRDLKFEKLVEWGMEIGNHTWTHPHLSKNITSSDHLQEELGQHQAWIEEVISGYRINSLALPMGTKPIEEWREYLYSGSYQGVDYSHDIVLLVGSVPAKPPNHVDWSPRAMPRVRASNVDDGYGGNYLSRALDRLETTRYVSDGYPDIITIPQSMESFLNQDSLGDKELWTYPD